MTTVQGDGTPVIVERALGLTDKAGYTPERLDSLIEDLIDNAESGAGLLKRYTPMLGVLMQRLQGELNTTLRQLAAPPPALPSPTLPDGSPAPVPAVAPPRGVPVVIDVVLDYANKVSIILDRLNKMTMNAVSTKDEATRLRTYLATGDEDTGGLDNLSENQLRRMVERAHSGWTKPESEDDPSA